MNWLQTAQDALCKSKLEDERQIKRRRIDCKTNVLYKSCLGHKRMMGDECLKTLELALNSFKGIERSRDQVRFHTAFINACLPHIYGSQWTQRAAIVMAERNLTCIDSEVMCMTPRRFGKTWAVAMFVAGLLCSVPNIRIAIFSTGQRASSSLTDTIKDFLKKLPVYSNFTEDKCNQEKLFIKHKSTGALSRLFSYPGATKTLRGCTADVVIMEEAAFIERRVFEEIVAPLLGVNKTAVLAISTPDEDEGNYYNVMMNMKKEDGVTPQFKTIRLGLVCEDCQLAGIVAGCTHTAELLPPWKSASRMCRVGRVLSKDRFVREMQGMVFRSKNLVFNKAQVARALADANRIEHGRATHVFVSVDPSAGGNGSDTAICSVIVVRGVHVIVGIDACAGADQAQMTGYILNHVAALRRRDEFKNALFTVFIEANLSIALSNSYADALQAKQFQPVFVPTERKLGVTDKRKNRYGVFTTAENKEFYVCTLSFHLHNNTLALAKNIVGQDPVKDIRDLQEQLTNYERKTKPVTNPFQNAKYTFSGKSDCTKDDLCLALQIVLYWMTQFYNTKHQKALARQYGIEI